AVALCVRIARVPPSRAQGSPPRGRGRGRPGLRSEAEPHLRARPTCFRGNDVRTNEQRMSTLHTKGGEGWGAGRGSHRLDLRGRALRPLGGRLREAVAHTHVWRRASPRAHPGAVFQRTVAARPRTCAIG